MAIGREKVPPYLIDNTNIMEFYEKMFPKSLFHASMQSPLISCLRILNFSFLTNVYVNFRLVLNFVHWFYHNLCNDTSQIYVTSYGHFIATQKTVLWI